MTLEHLISALVAMVTGLSADQARANADAAMAAATDRVPVELLLGMAYVESRYNPKALSRIECAPDDPESCARKTGVWLKATRPPQARPSWFCGPLQTGGWVSWDECQKMRTDVAYAYRIGVRELTAWLDDKRCARLDDDVRLRCALTGYNGGNAAVAAHRESAYQSKYARFVLLQRDRVVRFVERAATRQQPSES